MYMCVLVCMCVLIINCMWSNGILFYQFPDVIKVGDNLKHVHAAVKVEYGNITLVYIITCHPQFEGVR